MKLTFLGTSSMLPTKERNPFTVLLSYKNENILIDCAEGTQRQLRFINISSTKINKIFITHWHGDHILGLPGLLQTLATSNYNKTLEIYGPKRSNKFFKRVILPFVKEEKLSVKINEIKKEGLVLDDKDYIIKAIFLKHPTTCLGYSFMEKDKFKINLNYTKKFGLKKHPLLGKLQRGKSIIFKGKKIDFKKATIVKKGRKISFILDTSYIKKIINFTKNSDLLICESTFLDELRDKAREYGHLTSKQAAEIAKKSKSKKLLLTHFSQRYKNLKLAEKEAKKVFKNSFITKDFSTFTI